MALAHDKLIFLHIPKTGGIWVGQALRRCGLELSAVGHQHTHFPQLAQMENEKFFRDRFIFTMIRHPVMWYQSRWAFRVKHGWQSQHPLDFHCASNDFHTFVDNVLKYKPDGWVTWLYDQYIKNVPGGIDYVGKLETCVDDLSHVLKHLQIPFQDEHIRNVPRVNDSDLDGHSSKYWATYTPQLLDRVMAVEQQVINRFYSDYEIDPNILCKDRPW